MAIFDKISGISTGSGFKYQAEAPLDARLVVDNYTELAELVTGNGAYAGMLVYVKNSGDEYSSGYYTYNGTTWTAYLDYNNLINQPTITDNLESDSPTEALSANQGKVLKGLIDDISTDLGQLGYGDMLTSQYDTNKDGKVDHADNADKLGGEEASLYAKKSDLPTDTNTTYDLEAPASKTNGNVTIDLTAGGSGNGTDSIKIQGSGATTVTTDADGIITINSTVDTALNSSSTNPIQNKVVHSALADKLATTLKGAANGLAELDASGKVPSSQLPSYVDDVLDYTAFANFPTTGETGKIYVDKTTNKTYRWSGSAYAEISASLALGTTASTAYYGDKGKIAYDHSQAAHAPSDAQKNSDIKKEEIEAKLTGTITSHTHSYASLISHGTADPSSSTASQYYFKY